MAILMHKLGYDAALVEISPAEIVEVVCDELENTETGEHVLRLAVMKADPHDPNGRPYFLAKRRFDNEAEAMSLFHKIRAAAPNAEASINGKVLA